MTQYTKPNIKINSKSQGNPFDQRTGDGSNPQTYGKAYWKDKELYNSHQKGHPYSYCPNKKKKNDDDNKNYRYRKKVKPGLKTCPKI